VIFLCRWKLLLGPSGGSSATGRVTQIGFARGAAGGGRQAPRNATVFWPCWLLAVAAAGADEPVSAYLNAVSVGLFAPAAWVVGKTLNPAKRILARELQRLRPSVLRVGDELAHYAGQGGLRINTTITLCSAAAVNGLAGSLTWGVLWPSRLLLVGAAGMGAC